MKHFWFTALMIAGPLIWGQEVHPDEIVGLWEVTEVKVGNRNMTPQSRWMRFRADGTQESGNGWVKHSIGKYHVENGNELYTDNVNGMKDPYGFFTIAELNGDGMTWERYEEDILVRVTLKRVEVVSATHRDRLLGLWELDSVVGPSDSRHIPAKRVVMFFRWDNIYTVSNGDHGDENGIYQVHRHRPQLELVPYGDRGKIHRWYIDVSEDRLSLSIGAGDDREVQYFTRTHHFSE